ncbi:MAG: aryl-sulfate sulfotransferase [Acidobacteriota bacterium]|nr:aryl-sulfate sulfotransferase [Acidobacteriota bacterium]
MTSQSAYKVVVTVVLWSCFPACGAPNRDGGRQIEWTPGTAGKGPSTWVSFYDPGSAWNGYTLTLFHGRVPSLLDMNGHVVHSWPQARVKSRVRLLPDGSLLAISLGRGVVEYGWNGDQTWQFESPNGFAHHDVIRLSNGNTMFPINPNGRRTDDILEVDRLGKVVWEWNAGEYLAEYIDDAEGSRGDVTHINSIQELPPNRWFDAGDTRFRPGNLLLSARNLSEVFLVDKATKQVVWRYSDKLDRQHEALMIERGFPGEGNIILFNNGAWSRFDYRKSKIQEIDPGSGSVVWEYASDSFFSPTGGVEQPLPNGNVFVGSTRGGRAFEIDRAGRLVWQWTPPFDPVRPARYRRDHCPQLAALERRKPTPVRPPDGYRFISKRLYQYIHSGGPHLRTEKLDGAEQTVLTRNNGCRRLLLPERPKLWVSYGVDRGRVQAAGKSSYAASFRLLLRTEGTAEDAMREVELISDEVGLGHPRWRAKTARLDDFKYQWVTLCVETREEGAPSDEPTEEFAFWSNPVIAARMSGDAAVTEPPVNEDLSPKEQEARKEHLRALGYVD